MPRTKLISVVDDDESVRESLPDLLRSFDFEVEAFSSAEDFLASAGPDRTACLILDVAMPGMSGVELQLELIERRYSVPIVFITSHPNGMIKPLVLKRGAIACLSKPFSETEILEAVTAALAKP